MIVRDASVLVVDDEVSVRDALVEILRSHGFNASSATDGEGAADMVRHGQFEAALVDLVMPGLSGMDTLRRLKELSPDLEVIILTGQPTLESTIQAVREHVSDYLCKPVDMFTLVNSVSRAVERRRLILQNRELVHQLQVERGRLQREFSAAKRALERRLSQSPMFVGESEAIGQVRRFIAEVAPSDMTVLIRGESGTGKDVVANLIHESSGREGTGAFVKINCPAIPETLLESELFGHEAGAFTGAERRKPGRFELAVGGTLFLDEIGEIPPSLQVKLLQVIEHKQFTRLGGKENISVDARILAATNAPLERMIGRGQFRSDLFYRLNEYSIFLPPLRQRTEDIPILVNHFLREYGEKYTREDLRVSPETMAMLVRYPWPGNVRELRAVIKFYAFTGREDSIRESLRQAGAVPVESEPPSPPPVAAPGPAPAEHNNKSARLIESEMRTIMAALLETKWNQREAAKVLGISYSSLRRRIAKYDLKNKPVVLNEP